jgi:hypothetical protein
MTREEIEKQAAALSTKLFPDKFGDAWIADDVIAEAMHSLVSQAYEEAMQILDRRSEIADNGDVDTGAAVRAELDEACVEIRALKDSLAQPDGIEQGETNDVREV